MKVINLYGLFLFAITSCNQLKVYDCDMIESDAVVYRIRKTQIPVTGKMVCYFDNGKKMVEENFLNGFEHGKYIQCYSNGNIEWEDNFKYGLRDGMQTSYYETGKLMYVSYFRYGLIDGKETAYYETGKIRYEAFHKLGREDSTYTEFYPNGKLKSMGRYKFDDSDLLLKLNPVEDSAFIRDSAGIIIGTKFMRTSYYKPKNGLWKYWDDKGNLTEQIYKDGIGMPVK